MRIVRQNASAIVLQDSSLWVFVVCGAAALFVFAFALSHGQYRTLIAGVCLLLFALLWLRKSTFVFDAAAQSIRWTRFCTGRTFTGTIPFADVQDICVEATISGSTSAICRLSIQTAAGTTPMSDAYSVHQQYAATLRDTLLAFLRPSAGTTLAPSATNADAEQTRQLNNSIRSLLAQGRKIDAILLVRQGEHLDLTEATFRVNQVANQMATKQPAPKV
ncbi:MAG TPA: hypothetical protein VMD92_07555 [Acidobacteriaceae bacterium]|jgi:hypothetical protein|nr:hypothetical protein [Acidobacteriaceae bacterium]